PDPISALESESNPVRVRHLGSKGFLRNSTLRGDTETLHGPVVDPVHFYGLGAKNRLKNVSGATQSTRTANWRNQGTMISLSTGRFLDDTKSARVAVAGCREPSRDTKSAEPQILALTVRASP
ncbi:F-box family protein with DUF295, partial [Prunus dulcis]